MSEKRVQESVKFKFPLSFDRKPSFTYNQLAYS